MSDSTAHPWGKNFDPMTARKFQIGDMVYFIDRTRTSAASGTYEIVRLLPFESGQFLYRIKSTLERGERVVREDQITPPTPGHSV
ncbi:MAG: hypothetical protein ACTSYE_02240 [Alphaproteobacteria bacterium]